MFAILRGMFAVRPLSLTIERRSQNVTTCDPDDDLEVYFIANSVLLLRFLNVASGAAFCDVAKMFFG